MSPSGAIVGFGLDNGDLLSSESRGINFDENWIEMQYS